MAARAMPSLRRWIDPLARFGFAVRGVVYVLVGLLSAAAAAGLGGRATDPSGAITTVAGGLFGTVVLLVLGAGLGAYAAWRFTQAGLDLEGKGHRLEGLAVRASFVVSGLGHAALALTAVGLALGLRRGEHHEPVRAWTRRVLDAPAGEWIVGAAALAVIGIGVYQFYAAWAVRFENDLRTSRMTPAARRWSRRVGRAGLVTRGVIFAIMGWFLLRASLDANAHEAHGLGGAMRMLAHQDHGRVLLGLVALGLTAYGAMSMIDARYRRVT
jgi:uncharacterized protein DUF1206